MGGQGYNLKEKTDASVVQETLKPVVYAILCLLPEKRLVETFKTCYDLPVGGNAICGKTKKALP